VKRWSSSAGCQELRTGGTALLRARMVDGAVVTAAVDADADELACSQDMANRLEAPTARPSCWDGRVARSAGGGEHENLIARA
jgi:hypothetical protein